MFVRYVIRVYVRVNIIIIIIIVTDHVISAVESLWFMTSIKSNSLY